MNHKFEIVKKNQKVERGPNYQKTPHGDVPTPAFIPVGTKATVKGIPAKRFKKMEQI